MRTIIGFEIYELFSKEFLPVFSVALDNSSNTLPTLVTENDEDEEF